jgi:hypothetical protein
MKCNTWKVLLVFSALLMFVFTGELAAQNYQLTITPSNTSMKVGETQDFTATLTYGTDPVEGEDIVFKSIAADPLGTMDSPVTTNSLGKATSTYQALTVSGGDTIQASFTEATTRQTVEVTAIITVNPDPAAKVIATPADTMVIVTETVTIVAELIDNYGNHVDATSADEVEFTKLSGKGTLGSATLNGGKVEINYMTDDSMVTSPGDSILIKLVETGFADTSVIKTIGAAPDSVELSPATTTTVLVSNGTEVIWIDVQLYDQYGNPSGLTGPYSGEAYKVNFSVAPASTGGEFNGTGLDQIMVNKAGWGTIDYYSSMNAGDFTITGTSEGVSDDIGITHQPDVPATIVLEPDSAGIPAGSDTVLTATASDQYGNHINMKEWHGSYPISFTKVDGLGTVGSAFLSGDSLNWKAKFTAWTDAADTSHVKAFYGPIEDVVVIFSAEPGDLDHYKLEVLIDSSIVSDANIYEANAVRIEAQDASNIRIWTYENPDTVTLTLDGSAAGPTQVVWCKNPPVFTINGPVCDTLAVGLTALVPEKSFYDGQFFVGITNQIAETAPVTATDTAGHTGTSAGLTWLPSMINSFVVALEDGLTTINAKDDTVNIEVTSIDVFGNPTDSMLPRNVILSSSGGAVDFLSGETQFIDSKVSLIPMVALSQADALVLKVADVLIPAINGVSDPILVNPSGIAEGPAEWDISAAFGTGAISYAVAKDADVEIKVYNKVGMEVASVKESLKRGYHQLSLKDFDLASDIYFVVMKAPGVTKRVKATLVK